MSNERAPQIPWENFATFVRQLSHDLRNQLNAAELQAALINELTDDPELKPEVKRLRQLVSELGVSLQRLSASVAPARPNSIAYPAADLVQDLREKVQTVFPAIQINWTVDVGNAEAEVDPQLIEQVLLELLDNASRHSPSPEPLQAEVRASGDVLLISLREQKSKPLDDAASWATTPLRTAAHGHYGLGLRRARSIVEAHGGELRADYDANTSALVTKICLPLRAGS